MQSKNYAKQKLCKAKTMQSKNVSRAKRFSELSHAE
ncbi:hypothetical protein DFR28_10290 [Arenicella xantha]|uniref:Uncharacterized protein n=1 Tax=Arenicella xantha TaxID=644221 RepID=A0A395JJJ0_9GAMM|nr:hypothetical protein DFR28_10290 [Arenicella xantha]